MRLQPLVGFGKFSDSVSNQGPVPGSVRWAKHPTARQKLTRHMRMVWKDVSSFVVAVLVIVPPMIASRAETCKTPLEAGWVVDDSVLPISSYSHEIGADSIWDVVADFPMFPMLSQ